MAVDMFLKIDPPLIAGESKDKAHPGEIDILAWSWGVSNSGTTHTGGGGGGGKANFQDISFTSWYEKSTHELVKFCATGAHVDKFILTVRKAGTKPLEYIVYTMEDAIITSVSTGGSGGEDRLTVNFTINFSKLDIMYREQDDKGGKANEIVFKYDIGANADA
jgi:type VI secretion system secreted protein Hcp